MYKVYAIYNQEADKIYIGQTQDLERRLLQHAERTFKGYTSSFPGKWELIHQESVATRPEALSREKQLKSHRGRDYIRSKIGNYSGVAQR